MSGGEYGCGGCVYFEGVEWRGDEQYVICPELPGGESREVKIYRGCPARVPVSEAHRQRALF